MQASRSNRKIQKYNRALDDAGENIQVLDNIANILDALLVHSKAILNHSDIKLSQIVIPYLGKMQQIYFRIQSSS